MAASMPRPPPGRDGSHVGLLAPGGASWPPLRCRVPLLRPRAPQIPMHAERRSGTQSAGREPGIAKHTAMPHIATGTQIVRGPA